MAETNLTTLPLIQAPQLYFHIQTMHGDQELPSRSTPGATSKPLPLARPGRNPADLGSMTS